MQTEIARRAATDPDGLALTDLERSWTWAELDEVANRAANALRSLRLGPSARVGIMARNAGETVIAHLGALYAAVSVIPISFHLTAREVAYILRDGEAGAVLSDSPSHGVALEAATAVGIPAFAWGGADPGATTWDALVAAAEPNPPDLTRAPAKNLLYTSGTTGFPKGVERPSELPDTIAEVLVAAREPDDAGPFLCVGPLYHTGPLRTVTRLAGGRPVVILRAFDAELALQTVERYGVTGTLMVPTHFTRLLALPPEVRSRYDVSSLREVGHTGAACPPAVKRAMIAWFGPVLDERYGGTESGTLCRITSQEWLEHPGSVGRPVPPFEVVVVDDDDRELPVGESGRLYFRDTTGRGIEFFRTPDKTASVHLAPNVFTVGDSGHVDADGYVYITGRVSDMVVSGGVNLYPAESEAVLRTHELVADVAVIGVPHETMGEELKALVVRSDATLTAADLIAYCRERLAHPKCPRSVDFVDDLGRNAMGKVDKKALSAPYWAQITPQAVS